MATVVTPMKKLLNDPEQVVKESLTGLAAAHADLLRYDADAQIVVRADAPVQGKVALVSGGGSGHEPLHGGFVGRGMLDAACPGAVFTSPVPDQMLAATKAVNGGAGVVHIVKNYTGDVMNAGAAAERGDDVQSVAAVARRVNERARSFGIALSSCTPPAAGKPIFDLPDGEMEVGIGIHGEPGRRREPLGTAHEIATLMVEAVLADLEPESGTRVLPFVNGMGGTPDLELYVLYGEVDRLLRDAGLEPTRRLVGSYITSLEMAGASLTLLLLDEELTALWDAPVHTAALRWEA